MKKEIDKKNRQVSAVELGLKAHQIKKEREEKKEEGNHSPDSLLSKFFNF